MSAKARNIIIVVIVLIVAVFLILKFGFDISFGIEIKQPAASTSEIHTPSPTRRPKERPAEEPAARPAEEPIEQLNASVFSGNLADYPRVFFTGAEASSTAGTYDGSTFYNAGYAIDSIVSTSWQEGVAGYGIGETLKLSMNGEQDISVLSFVMGSHTFENYYEENGKPRQIRFDFSNGDSFVYEFPQVSEQYTIILNRPVTASWILLTIESVYSGSKFEDTAIAEIAAFGTSGVSAEETAKDYTETEYYSNGAIYKETVYSAENDTTMVYEYYSDGEVKSFALYYDENNYEITKYNRDGTTDSTTSQWLDPNNGVKQTEKHSYEYYKGALVKETTENHGETWISEYNRRGELVRETYIDANGNKTVTKK